MVVEYFIICGVLLTGYCLVRPIWLEFRTSYRPPPPSEPYTGAVTSIDISHLSDRLQQLRHDGVAHIHKQSPSFKRSLLVENRREKLSQYSYFHKPPPPP